MATVSDHLSDQDAAMFNKVHTLSDILCANLKEIDRNVFECRATTTIPKASKEAYRWPRIPAPSQLEIKIWKSTLGKIFTVIPSNLRLQGEEAREWKEDAIAYSSWSTNQTKTAIYQKEGDQLTLWSPIDTTERTRSRTRPFRKSHPMQKPNNIIPCSIRYDINTMYIHSAGTTTSIDDPILTNWKNLGWMLPNITITPEAEKEFVEDIIKGTARMVSDGSYASGRSSSAFNTLTDTPITGSNPILGDSRDQSSYGGELGGILPAIIVQITFAKNTVSAKDTAPWDVIIKAHYHQHSDGEDQAQDGHAMT
jgi:hypothetical protein